MTTAGSISDRRRPFLMMLGECLAAVLAFPIATLLVAPELLEPEIVQIVLRQCALALLILNLIVILLDPAEPMVWDVPRAIIAGVWRASLLCVALFGVLFAAGNATVVPAGLFILAWGCLAAVLAALRMARFLASSRIPI